MPEACHNLLAHFMSARSLICVHHRTCALLSNKLLYSDKLSFTILFWQADSKVHIHWKGAAEMVLASCTGYLDSNGSLQSIDKEMASVLLLKLF